MNQIANPYLPLDEYIADGEPHVFNDRIYIFGSHDRAGGRDFCLDDYVAYSAPIDNLTAWKYEGIIYRKDQDPNCSSKRKNLYAPDVVRGNDGRYYLYYCLEGFEGPISVAVCEKPAGQYQYYGDVKNESGEKFLKNTV